MGTVQIDGEYLKRKSVQTILFLCSRIPITSFMPPTVLDEF